MSERWRLRPSGDTTVEIPESFALVAGNVVRVPPAVISVVPSWRPQAIVGGAVTSSSASTRSPLS